MSQEQRRSERDELEELAIGIGRLLMEKLPERYAIDPEEAGQAVEEAFAMWIASDSLGDAAATFLRFGDRRRYAEARLFEAATLYAAGAVDRALEIWTPLENAPALDDAGRLRVAYNIALCFADLGRHDEAIPYLSRCTMQFALRRMATESTRSRAALGKALLGAGQPAGALIVLRQAGGELDDLGLIFDAGLVALQEAEALLALDQPEGVPAVCRAAIALFTRAGVTAYAATALAYLREATAMTPAAPKLVRAAYVSLRQSRVQLTAAPAPPPS